MLGHRTRTRHKHTHTHKHIDRYTDRHRDHFCKQDLLTAVLFYVCVLCFLCVCGVVCVCVCVCVLNRGRSVPEDCMHATMHTHMHHYALSQSDPASLCDSEALCGVVESGGWRLT